MTMRGGVVEGACGRGAAVAFSQASQGDFVVRPSKGLGSRWRFGSGGGSVVGHVAESLGHRTGSMMHSHTRATSTNWEKKRWETMAKPPHTGGEMRDCSKDTGFIQPVHDGVRRGF